MPAEYKHCSVTTPDVIEDTLGAAAFAATIAQTRIAEPERGRPAARTTRAAAAALPRMTRKARPKVDRLANHVTMPSAQMTTKRKFRAHVPPLDGAERALSTKDIFASSVSDHEASGIACDRSHDKHRDANAQHARRIKADEISTSH